MLYSSFSPGRAKRQFSRVDLTKKPNQTQQDFSVTEAHFEWGSNVTWFSRKNAMFSWNHGKIWLGRDLWRPPALSPHPSMGNCRARWRERLSGWVLTLRFGDCWSLQRSLLQPPKINPRWKVRWVNALPDGCLVPCRASRPEEWPAARQLDPLMILLSLLMMVFQQLFL